MKKIMILATAFLALNICHARGGGNGTLNERNRAENAEAVSGGILQDEAALIKKGDKMPAFEVEMLDGSKINSDMLKGKVVLINFWATWCGPCRQELARVRKDILGRFGSDKNFVLLMISRGETREKVEKFRDEAGYTDYPFALDPQAKVYSLFATKYIPRNFLIGPDGTVLESESGYSPEAFDRLADDIEKALKKK